ncbi:MAG: hypothetical protein IJQ33_13010 [Clostridia bacterium]|nr:hypothetical protein [Clostridia bacterium]
MPTILDLSGIWQCEIPGKSGALRLPGTLDESGIGFPDDPKKQWKVDEVARIGFYREGDPIVTRLTRKHAFEGQAKISRIINLKVPEDKRLFIDVERARHLRLLVNGEEILPYNAPSISTPYVFEVTGKLTGDDQIVFLSDNSYPGWPRDAIVYSSAASDETQTNWNGLLGYIRLRAEEQSFIDSVRVYPDGEVVSVYVEVDAARDWEGEVRLSSDALEDGTVQACEHVKAGRHELVYFRLNLRHDWKEWDIEEGNLYDLTVSLNGMESKTVSFGARDFEAWDGHLTLNGRQFFLRGEANCAVFPETGYPPMDKDSWKAILQKYRDYGVNCMRFHSHCPPEAAFAAADEMGMLMQPELSHWDPEHAFSTEEARAYYKTEFLGILDMLANHPSFVMLTFGNELQTDEAGRAFMDELLKAGRDKDPTRLYANASNCFYGLRGPDPQSDFFTTADIPGHHLRATSAECRGWLNQEGPDFRVDYQAGAEKIIEQSGHLFFAFTFFSFEVGQYEVLPDFDEISLYQGVTSPENLKHIQKKVRAAGLEEEWKRQVEATGELSLLCYRAEVEAALRTAGYSGISLLGLQDFPGQGTALVGMMNAHLQPKPYDFAKPERFRAFFRDSLPLALLPRVTYTVGETLQAEIKMAHYGKSALSGTPEWTLQGETYAREGKLPFAEVWPGELAALGTLSVPLTGLEKAEKLTLTLKFCGNENQYSLWVYPDERPVCPETVYECRTLDERAKEVLASGGKVFLAPDATPEALPHSIKTQFSTDFWSVCTFPTQAGGMGQLIDAAHPIFRDFPTDSHTDWQWWPMAVQRAVILPERIRAIVTEMDSYAFLRPMAKLFECRCGGGRLLFSTLNLHHLQGHPEARALLKAIYGYMASDEFQPVQALSPDWVAGLVSMPK